MPHASFKIKPGVDQNETPALNEAGISTSNLIRFIFDREGKGLVQKLGGWTKFYANQTVAKVRALWAWADTNANSWLAFGTENQTSVGHTNQAYLGVVGNGNLPIASRYVKDITPTYSYEDITPVVSTIAGSEQVVITDTTTTGITLYDSVYIPIPMSIGGTIIFGLYQCDPDGYSGPNSYSIFNRDALGQPSPVPSTSTTVYLPQLTTTSGSNIVTVTLPDHGYSVGDTFPILISSVINGVTFYGNYIVKSVASSSQFEIDSTLNANASGSAYLNNNKQHYIYSYGVGAISAGSAYGVGAYGSGGYGTGTASTPAIGSPIPAMNWTLDNWGQVLLSCPTYPAAAPPFQPIYQWDPTSGSPTATILPNAPVVSEGIFVAMPQRQIIAWGTTFNGIQDPLLIRWCDVNDYDVWIGQITNQAGSYRIPKGSKIVGAIQGPQQGLIWTDLGLWAMQYTGPPYVYSFNELGTGCGLIAKKAAASLNGAVYWMGASQFFSLTANGVESVACPVWDVIFQDLDTDNLDKIRVAVNSRFGEITWYYPVKGTSEVNSYVKYNALLKQWDFGTLSRSAWVDQSVLGPPIGADPTTLYLYQHETSTDADGQAMNSSFQTGYFAMSEADLKIFVDQVWPDMKWGYYGGTQNATVNITFYVTDYSGQTPVAYGPYPMTQSTTFITPRFRGRLVSIKIDSNDVGSFWRIGNIRYRLQQDGKF